MARPAKPMKPVVRRRLRPARILTGLAAAVMASAAAYPASAGQGAGLQGGGLRSTALELVEAQIAEAFADVSHISVSQLASMLKERPGQIVLLDVRTGDEHAVSRLAGAIHVSPETRSAGEVAALAGDLAGKTVVVYCAIGLRSARLLVRIGQALKEKGAAELHNLTGGAFRWRNEGRPLVGPDGPTRAIHPYNPLWRQLLLEAPDR